VSAWPEPLGAKSVDVRGGMEALAFTGTKTHTLAVQYPFPLSVFLRLQLAGPPWC